MTDQARAGFWRTAWHRKWLVIVPLVVSTVTTMIVVRLQPVRYRSEATIMVVPSPVGANVVSPMFTASPEDRVQQIAQSILTRTRLERIVVEQNLYAAERKTGVMQDVIENMRSRVSVSPVGHDAFRVTFFGGDPTEVALVANKLAALFIDESVKHRINLTDASAQFVELTLDAGRKKLTQLEAQVDEYKARNPGRKVPEALSLEFEVAREHYKSLLLKERDIRIYRDLERRQAGEQFQILDLAKAPLTPLGPSRWQTSATGVGIGLAVGFALLMASSRRRRAEAAA